MNAYRRLRVLGVTTRWVNSVKDKCKTSFLWFLLQNFKENHRCFQPSISGSPVCAEEFTHNPDNIQHVLLSKPLSRPLTAAGGSYSYSESGSFSQQGSSSGSSSGSAAGEIVQIQPQRLKLQLRPRKSKFREFEQDTPRLSWNWLVSSSCSQPFYEENFTYLTGK